MSKTFTSSFFWPLVSILLKYPPDNDNLMEAWRGGAKSRVSAFPMKEITSPLDLYEQEQLAQQLIDKILSEEAAKTNSSRLPQHLEEVKNLFDPSTRINTKLPVLSQISPRTKRRLALLPKPNDFELQQVRKLERMTKQVGGEAIYKQIAADPVEAVYHEREIEEEITSLDFKGNIIPSTVDKEVVEHQTTKMYEDAEKYQQRKAKQVVQLTYLFKDEDDNNQPKSPKSPKTSPGKPRSAKSPDNDSLRSKLKSVGGSLDNSSSIGGGDHQLKRSSSSLMSGSKGPVASFSYDVGDSLDAASIASGNNSSFVLNPASSNQRQKFQDPYNLLKKATNAGAHHKLTRTSSSTKHDSSHNTSHAKKAASSSSNLLFSSTSQPAFNLQQAGYHSLATSSSSYMPLMSQWQKEAEIRAPTTGTHQDSSSSNNPVFSVKAQRKFLNEFSAKVYDEIGLNLNAEYNRIKAMRDALKIFILHLYRCRLRAGITRWQEVTVYLRKLRVRAAAMKVYQTIKAGVYWNHLQQKRHFARLQREEAERREQLNQEFLNKMAAIITQAIRYGGKIKQIRYLVRVRRAATGLQRRWRGCRGRQKYLRYKKMYTRRRKCAIIIQGLVRQRFSARRVALMRKLAFVNDWLQRQQKYHLTCRDGFHSSGAASYIARVYRNYTIKQRLRVMLYWHRFKQAINIQRVYRGYRTYKQFKETLKNHRDRIKREQFAVTLLQKNTRRFLARTRTNKLQLARLEQFERRKQMKLFKLAAGTSALKAFTFQLIKFGRKLVPFRYVILHSKAVIIQTIWRAYHAKVRIFYIRIRVYLRKYSRVMRFKGKAIIKIQKLYRGYQTRQKIRAKRTHHLIIRLQCAVRVYRSHKRFQRLKKVNSDAVTLTRHIRRLIKRHHFRHRYKRDKMLGERIVIIQTFFRRILAVCHVRLLRKELRTLQERQLRVRTSLIHLLFTVQLRILHDTITKPISQRYYVVSKIDCSCLGPLQALFVLCACGNKTRTEIRTLTTNKLENQNLIKFLNRIDGLIHSNTHNAKRNMHLQNASGINFETDHILRETRYLSPESSNDTLLTALKNGDVFLPKGQKKLTSVEIDIIFSKSKSVSNVSHKLTYKEFVGALELIAFVHYTNETTAIDEPVPEQQETAATADSNNSPQQQSQQSAVAGNADTTVESKEDQEVEDKEATQEAERAATPAPADDGQAFDINKLLQEKNREINRDRTLFNIHTLTLSPSTVLKTDYRLCLILRVLYCTRDEPYTQEILHWLDIESKARVGLFITRIQCLFRQVKSKLYVAKVRIESERRKLEALAQAKVIRAQSIIRSFIHRRNVMLLAQQTLIKYVPYLGEPYWLNPVTQVRSAKKPKILGHLESYSIALPEEGLQFVVKCYDCQIRNAVRYCDQCEDSMCQICYDSLHCKGQRVHHTHQRIPCCSYCKIQMACKSCITCIVEVPKTHTYRATIPHCDRGTYCDTCFVHEHDHFAHLLERDEHRRKGLKTLLQSSKEAYLLHTFLLQRLQTKHKYDQLVQACEECQVYSASWRCYDCEQVYCHRCLLSLHNGINLAFTEHKVEELPYYTPSMHQSLLKDISAQKFHLKWDKMLILARQKRQEQEFHAAVIIQAWWRMVFYKHVGLQVMHRRRRKMRSAYRLRKKETLMFRNSINYKLKDIFGMAPPLSSDTREETVLRSLTVFKREEARCFIRSNVEDWGYYRKSKSRPRKGNPKVSFAVGELHELIDQAHRGGYRLPGRVIVHVNERVLRTTCDLSVYLRRGEIVRIHGHFFGVVSVDRKHVKVNRCWHADTTTSTTDDDGNDFQSQSESNYAESEEAADMPSHSTFDPNHPSHAEGEIMYRMPTYRGEAGRLQTKLKYLTYEWLVNNPLSQAGLVSYRLYTQRLMTTSLYFYKLNRRNKQYAEAAEWKAQAVLCASNIQWAASMVTVGDAFVDLSKLSCPYPNGAPTPLLISQQKELKMKKGAVGRKTISGDHDDSDSDSSNNDSDASSSSGDDSDIEDDEEEGEGEGEGEGLLKKNKHNKHHPHKHHKPHGNKVAAITDSHDEEDDKFDAEGRPSSPAKSSARSPNKSTASSRQSKKKSKTNASVQNNFDENEQKDDEEDDDAQPIGENDEDEDGPNQMDLVPSVIDPETGMRMISTAEERKRKRQALKAEKIAKTKQARETRRAAADEKKKNKDDDQDSKKKKKTKTNKMGKAIFVKPAQPWFADKQQEAERKAREDSLTKEELAAEAGDWEETVDIRTANTIYVHKITNEMMAGIPRAVQAKRTIDFENSRKKKDYDDAIKRIQRLDMETGHRLLITGGRKR